MKHNFGEKETEYYAKSGEALPVWQSPKFLEAREAAIKLIESADYKNVLSDSDFWILMNATKNGKMAYTGLIISHNGCLKINDKLPADKKFKPSCLTVNESGYKGALVYSYCNDDQGIYEVGEVTEKNCENKYPYAMALKRCMDRVILKSSKIAYSGIYSDSEADEFAQRIEAKENEEFPNASEEILDVAKKENVNLDKLATKLKKDKSELTDTDVKMAINANREYRRKQEQKKKEQEQEQQEVNQNGN